MKTTVEIAERLIALLKQQQFVEAYRELFADDAISIDPIYAGQPPLQGLDLLVERESQFLSRSQVNGIKVYEALIAANWFTISLEMDFTSAGKQRTIAELCVYK